MEGLPPRRFRLGVDSSKNVTVVQPGDSLMIGSSRLVSREVPVPEQLQHEAVRDDHRANLHSELNEEADKLRVDSPPSPCPAEPERLLPVHFERPRAVVPPRQRLNWLLSSRYLRPLPCRRERRQPRARRPRQCHQEAMACIRHPSFPGAQQAQAPLSGQGSAADGEGRRRGLGAACTALRWTQNANRTRRCVSRKKAIDEKP